MRFDLYAVDSASKNRSSTWWGPCLPRPGRLRGVGPLRPRVLHRVTGPRPRLKKPAPTSRPAVACHSHSGATFRSK
jgi:hypothetical protein